MNLEFFLSPSKREPIKALAADPSTEDQWLGPVLLFPRVLASEEAVTVTSEVPWLGVDGESLLFLCSRGESCSSQKESRRCTCSLESVSQCSGQVRDF